MCEKHRARWRRHGDPNVVLKDHTPASERWKTSYEVDESTGCWNWTARGSMAAGGYGLISDGQANQSIPAHRFVYEQKVGPIPDEMQLDHLCRNKSCVNPEHLEIVTPSENILRAVRARADGPLPDNPHNRTVRECVAARRARLRDTPHCCNYCGATTPSDDPRKLCKDCRAEKHQQYLRAKARKAAAS